MAKARKSLDEYLRDYEVAINRAKEQDMYAVIIAELERNRQKIEELKSRVKSEKQEKRLVLDVAGIIEELLEKTAEGNEVATFGLLRQIRDNTVYAELALTLAE